MKSISLVMNDDKDDSVFVILTWPNFTAFIILVVIVYLYENKNSYRQGHLKFSFWKWIIPSPAERKILFVY